VPEVPVFGVSGARFTAVASARLGLTPSQIAAPHDRSVAAITPAEPCSLSVGIRSRSAHNREPSKTQAGHIFDCSQGVLVPIAQPEQSHLASFRPGSRIVYAEFALPIDATSSRRDIPG
jgi:hypothetical protein